MSNYNFTPIYSTNMIYRNEDDSRCLTDDLDTIESGITSLETSVEGKADSDHIHSGYAEASHTHTGYADAEHTHTPESIGAAAEGHTHDYAASSHSHAQAEVTDLEDVLAGKADRVVFANSTSASAYKLVYLSTAGSDDNDGFSATTPMLTIKGAIRKYAEKYKLLDIRLADGTYTEDIGAIAVDLADLSIRSVSADKDAVTINMATALEANLPQLRMYNMTLNVTKDAVRPISVNNGKLYCNNLRVNVPTTSTYSCINVYNGCVAFLFQCVLNGGTDSSAGAAVYGNQATLIKAIDCTSERTNNIAFHAHNGTDIQYTDTITATTVTKETYYGVSVRR